MKKNYIKILIGSILITAIGVFVVDYFSHLFFSNPMETIPYFFAKATWYVIASFIFLSTVDLRKKETTKIIIGAIIVATIWGAYYNVLPEIFNFYPFGLSLYSLTFLGMGIFGTGVAFGTVHTVAFIVGYYVAKKILRGFK